jgi:hypothetical protein
MKFTVREGFVIHQTRLVEVNGKQVEQTNSYYEGDNVDFEADEARAQLHKLEPKDKAADAFCQAAFAKVDPLPTPAAGGITPEQLSAAVAQAVASTLAAMGVQAPAKTPA